MQFFVWGLIEYDRVVYIDSDIYMRSVPDDLLEHGVATLGNPHPIAAVGVDAPGNTTPTIFNSGFLVLTPNMTVLDELLATERVGVRVAKSGHVWGASWNNETALPKLPGKRPYGNHAGTGPFRGDQFYLNGYFHNGWARLDGKWNVMRHYFGAPQQVRSDENVHFVGDNKPPWHLCVHHTYI